MEYNLSQAKEDLPLQMKYSQMVPVGVSSRTRRVKYMPQNAGTFGTSNRVIRIPINSSTCFVDGSQTYLKMVFKNTSTVDCYFDGSGHSLIEQMRLISSTGGCDLENIRNYSPLMSMLSDLQLGTAGRFNRQMEGYGCAGNYSANTSVVATVPTLDADSGEILGCPTDASIGTGETLIPAGKKAYLYLPILSSLIGANAEKYCPLFLIGEMVLEIVLSASIFSPVVYVSTSPLTYEINEVSLNMQLLEFQGSLNSTLKTMTDTTGLQLHACCWATFFNSVSAGTGSIQITEKLHSVKSLFLTFHNPAVSTNTTRTHGRNHNDITDLQLKIGSEYIPAMSIRGTADAGEVVDKSEFLIETLKAIGEYNNNSNTGIISHGNFCSKANSRYLVGRSVYGLDLDSFTKCPTQSGIDFYTNSPCLVNYASTNNEALNSIVYLLYDCYFVLTKDGAFTKSS